MACNFSGVVNNAPVRLVRPDNVVSLDIDMMFRCDFSEVLHCCCVQLVNDIPSLWFKSR